MIMPEDFPTVNDSDEDLVAWVRARGNNLYPKHFVDLREAVSSDQPDIALIHFDLPGTPVERIKRVMS